MRSASLVLDTGLIRQLESGTPIYRARPHGIWVAFDRAADLGTAAREKAFVNRMSPAGIPLFYGAVDAGTAVREAWAGPASGKELVSVGRFTNSAPLPVSDLPSLSEIPSIFDEARRHLRPPLRLLHEFSARINALVRSAARTEAETVEYPPTQIVRGYFRAAFARDYGPEVSGLLYRSAARKRGCAARSSSRPRTASTVRRLTRPTGRFSYLPAPSAAIASAATVLARFSAFRGCSHLPWVATGSAASRHMTPPSGAARAALSIGSFRVDGG
jgi:RES domain